MATSENRRPHFLIIGAMKAATTTLYNDLMQSEGIFLPAQKEPDALIRNTVLTPRGRSRYFGLYKRAQPHQLCGDASTSYAKRPTYESVPERALEVLGPGIRIIYIMRDRFRRLISHYEHEVLLGHCQVPLTQALEFVPGLVEYSCYAYQLEPWLRHYPLSHFMFVRFEDYISARQKTVLDVLAFLNAPGEIPLIEEHKQFNRSEGRLVPHKMIRKYFIETDLYQRYIKPLAPQRLREFGKRISAPPPRKRQFDLTLTSAQEERIGECFAADAAALKKLLGCALVPCAPPQEALQMHNFDMQNK